MKPAPAILAAIVAFTAGIAYLWYTTHRGPVVPNEALKAVGRTPPVPRPAPIGRTTRASPSFQGRPLWYPVEESGVGGSLPAFEADWSEEGRQLVDVSEAVAAAPTWEVGDAIAIDLPQLGERYESKIVLIERDPAGYSRAVHGLIVGDDGHARRFVVTVGPTRVFAYVDTPVGPYELVGDTRLGWLLPTSSMLAGWDYQKPDYIVLEHDEMNHATR